MLQIIALRVLRPKLHSTVHRGLCLRRAHVGVTATPTQLVASYPTRQLFLSKERHFVGNNRCAHLHPTFSTAIQTSSSSSAARSSEITVQEFADSVIALYRNRTKQSSVKEDKGAAFSSSQDSEMELSTILDGSEEVEAPDTTVDLAEPEENLSKDPNAVARMHHALSIEARMRDALKHLDHRPSTAQVLVDAFNEAQATLEGPTLQHYRLFITFLCHRREWSRATAMLKQAFQAGVLHSDVSVYTSILAKLFELQFDSIALHMFEVMFEIDMCPSAVTFGCVIHHMFRRHEVDKALSVFKRMGAVDIRPNLVLCCVMVHGLANHKRFDDAVNLFQEARLAGIVPNRILLVPLLTKLLSSPPHLWFCIQLVELIFIHQFTLDVPVLLSLTEHALESDQPRLVRRLYDILVAQSGWPSFIPFVSRLLSLMSSREALAHVDTGLSIAEDVVRMRRLTALQSAVTGMMQHAARFRPLAPRVWQLFEDLPKFGMPYQAKSYSAAVRALFCVRQLEVPRLHELLQSIYTKKSTATVAESQTPASPPCRSWRDSTGAPSQETTASGSTHSSAALADIDTPIYGVLSTLNEIREYRLTVEAYDWIVANVAQGGSVAIPLLPSPSQVDQTAESTSVNGNTAFSSGDVSTGGVPLCAFNTVLEALCRKNNSYKALGLMKARLSDTPQASSYNYVLRGFLSDRNDSRANAVMAEMNALGFVLDDLSYCSIINFWGKGGRLDEAMALLHKMRLEQIPVAPLVLRTFFTVCADEARMDLAEEMWDEFVPSGIMSRHLRRDQLHSVSYALVKAFNHACDSAGTPEKKKLTSVPISIFPDQRLHQPARRQKQGRNNSREGRQASVVRSQSSNTSQSIVGGEQ